MTPFPLPAGSASDITVWALTVTRLTICSRKLACSRSSDPRFGGRTEHSKHLIVQLPTTLAAARTASLWSVTDSANRHYQQSSARWNGVRLPQLLPALASSLTLSAQPL